MSKIQELIEEKKRERERIDEVIRQLEGALAAEEGIRAPETRKTILQMAEIVLQEEKKALKPREIADRIQQKFGRFVKAASLGTMLHRCATVSKKKTFKKDSEQENTYSLREWQ